MSPLWSAFGRPLLCPWVRTGRPTKGHCLFIFTAVKFIYHNTRLPEDRALQQQLEQAASVLEKKMRQLKVDQLPISDYARRYYAYDLTRLQYMLQSYTHLLCWSVFHRQLPLQECHVLDHGGGIGMLSMLASLAGAKTVIYQDLNQEVCEDAKVISQALGIEIHHFLAGDTADFIRQLQEKQLQVDLFASRNVVEHIYNLDDFFAQLKQLPAARLVLFLSTSANQHNPLVLRQHRRFQRVAEYQGARTEWGGKLLDPERAVFRIRRKWLMENYPALQTGELEKLTALTRGFRVDDMKRMTDQYLATGIYPQGLSDPTNTCDPYTGNWAEHLVPLSAYRRYCEKNGFEFHYYNGFYNTNYAKTYLNLITPVLNTGIRLLGRKGNMLAPYISICAVRSKPITATAV